MPFINILPVIASALFLSIYPILIYSWEDPQPIIVLYDKPGQAGESYEIDSNYIPDLNIIGWDNRAQSICFKGGWMLYDLPNYNTGFDASVEYVFTHAKRCLDLSALKDKVTSLRYIGKTDDFRIDSITLFEGTYFSGNETYTISHMPYEINLTRSSSAVVTGNAPWTMYNQTLYKEQSVCLFPHKRGFPTFVPDLKAIPNSTWGSYNIGSVAKGCMKWVELRPSVNPIHGVHDVPVPISI